MKIAFIFSVIGYLGLIRFQIVLYKKGRLAEETFVLFQLALLSLMVFIGALIYSSGTTSIWVAAIFPALFWVIGYPVGKRLYRYYLSDKYRD